MPRSLACGSAWGCRLRSDVVRAGGCELTLRRFAGSQAEEFAFVGRPDPRTADPARQAEAVYREVATLLSRHEASFGDVAGETLFLRDIRRDLPGVLEGRERALAELGQSCLAPPPAFIEQAPVAQGTRFELASHATVPRSRRGRSADNVRASPSCRCEGCARSGARLVRFRDRVSLHASNVYGVGADAFAQAWDMFCGAERLLADCGLEFRDVVRTWIHLRDIARDYDALNEARSQFFRSRGIEPKPASTGVQGTPLPDAHDFSMIFQAVQSPVSLDVAPMSTPLLNEAWCYGVDFSRGLKLIEADKVTLYISGTASIDEEGRTIHVGDFEAQANRMLDNIESLLARQGAGFDDLLSAVTYVTDPADGEALRSLCRRRGFDGFPCALVQAPLCRPELLCETEAVALLPLESERA